MTQGIGRACGKVILLGEHAVVYGAPAIAAGIHRGARCVAEPLVQDCASTLALAGQVYRVDQTGQGDLNQALKRLLDALDAPPVHLKAESDLPLGGGLGSSAALAIAIARAVQALCKGDADPCSKQVLAAAAAWEGVFHGNPSGVDTTAAAYGSCLRFCKQDGPVPLVARCDLSLCVGLSGVGSSTRVMVEQVARLFARKPEMQEASIAGIRALVENAVLAIQAGDLIGLGRLMDLNQMLLAGLFVSTDSIETLCSLARKAGALGAKLTGAGGGGSVIALLPPVETDHVGQRILEAWRNVGYDGFMTHIQSRMGNGE